MSQLIQGRSPKRESVVLVVAVGALVAAFIWLPALLVGGATTSRSALHRSTADAVAAYWQGGRGPWTDDVRDLVRQWRNYHVAKAVIAGAALIVLVRAAASGRRRASTAVRPMLNAAGVTAAWIGALAAVILLMANVQGAVAPFASLLSLLPTTTANRSFAPTLGGIREALAQRSISGRAGPAPLERMIDAFVGYHVVLAVLAGALAVLAAGFVIRSFGRRRRAAGAIEPLARPSRATLAGTVVLCIAAGVLCLANVSTALQPVPALRGVFG